MKHLSLFFLALVLSVFVASCGGDKDVVASAVGSDGLAQQSACVVTRVVDGDTVVATVEGLGEVKIRLVGIDAPELSQPYGDKAAEFLRHWAKNKAGQLELDGNDRYGRLLGTLHIDGVNVCEELVGRGLAWHYIAYSSDAALARAELQARGEAVGLWADEAPEAPWDFRHKGSAGSADGNGVETRADTLSSESVSIFLTRTGSKYHRGSCRFLAKSRIPTSLDKVQGKYAPCKVCKPAR